MEGRFERSDGVFEEGDDDGNGNASARRTKEGEEEEDYVKPVENKCFPMLQHKGDSTWGRYADFDHVEVKKTENKEVELFQKILQKVSGKEPEECVDTSRATNESRANGRNFLEGLMRFSISDRALVRRRRRDANKRDWVIRLNGHNAPKKFSRDAKDMIENGWESNHRSVGEHRVGPFHFVREESGKLVDVFHVFS